MALNEREPQQAFLVWTVRTSDMNKMKLAEGGYLRHLLESNCSSSTFLFYNSGLYWNPANYGEISFIHTLVVVEEGVDNYPEEVLGTTEV